MFRQKHAPDPRIKSEASVAGGGYRFAGKKVRHQRTLEQERDMLQRSERKDVSPIARAIGCGHRRGGHERRGPFC